MRINPMVKDAAAMLAIGDGMLALLNPERHVSAWNAGPAWWTRIVARFEGKPGLTRAMGAAGVALGLWLGLQAGGARRDRPS